MTPEEQQKMLQDLTNRLGIDPELVREGPNLFEEFKDMGDQDLRDLMYQKMSDNSPVEVLTGLSVSYRVLANHFKISNPTVATAYNACASDLEMLRNKMIAEEFAAKLENGEMPW